MTEESTGRTPRIGIVYSAQIANRFDEEFVYHQLLLFVQQQACMAGVPYDLIDVSELRGSGGNVQQKRFGVLVVPWLPIDTDGAIDVDLEHVTRVVEGGETGLILAGGGPGYATGDNTDPGLFDLLGIQFDEIVSCDNAELLAGAAAGRVLGNDIEWPLSELFDVSFHRFIQAEGHDAIEVARLQCENRRITAIAAGSSPAPYVYFGTVALLTCHNLLWRAMRWVVHGDDTAVGLNLSRNRCVMANRVDMDLSMYSYDMIEVARPLVDLFAAWRQQYGFICSAYINIGAKEEHELEFTDWEVSGPLYRGLADMGSEIGCHSYSHPFHTSELLEEELEFEFGDSNNLIEQNLGVAVHGAAVPGNPESLGTALQIGQYYDYVSGRFSGYGDGFAGAIGLLKPGSRFLYFCPNLWPDYTAIRYFGWTVQKTCTEWARQSAALFENARSPVVQPLWHDYGMILESGQGFGKEIYEFALRWATEHGAEFATLREVAARIRALSGAALRLNRNGSAVEVSVTSQSASLGAMCLTVDGDDPISGVDGWYAYNEKQVFLPRGGGVFLIRLGGLVNDSVRIIALPPRAELLRLTGTEEMFEFEIDGEGEIELDTAGQRIRIEAGPMVEAGAMPGDANPAARAVLRLKRQQVHTIRIVIDR